MNEVQPPAALVLFRVVGRYATRRHPLSIELYPLDHSCESSFLYSFCRFTNLKSSQSEKAYFVYFIADYIKQRRVDNSLRYLKYVHNI